MSSLCAHKYPSDFLLTYGEVGSFSLTGSKDERQKLRRCASVSEGGTDPKRSRRARRTNPERSSNSEKRHQRLTIALSWRLFQNSRLKLLLALDAVPRPRHRFQPLGINFLTAGDALAEITLANAVQGTFHHLKKLPIVIALGKQEFLVVRTGGTVGNILGRIFIRAATVLLGTGDGAAQLLLPRFQAFFKIVQFFLVHDCPPWPLQSLAHLIGANEDDMRSNQDASTGASTTSRSQ